MKLIPFERHFKPEEQDTGLKDFFKKGANKSGILNWLIVGYQLLKAEGLTVPEKVNAAITAYRQEADIIGSFLCECTMEQEGKRLLTNEMYSVYAAWAKDNGCRACLGFFPKSIS